MDYNKTLLVELKIVSHHANEGKKEALSHERIVFDFIKVAETKAKQYQLLEC